jgi:hypothetical protein
MESYSYTELYKKLTYEAMVIIFLKKDGTVRVMLGTRNLDIAKVKFGWINSELSKMDKRCSVDNGNVGIIDLILGEGRCFNVNRLIWVKSLGVVTDEAQYDKMIQYFAEFTNDYTGMMPDFLTTGLSSIEELREKVKEQLKDYTNSIENLGVAGVNECVDVGSVEKAVENDSAFGNEEHKEADLGLVFSGGLSI